MCLHYYSEERTFGRLSTGAVSRIFGRRNVAGSSGTAKVRVEVCKREICRSHLKPLVGPQTPSGVSLVQNHPDSIGTPFPGDLGKSVSNFHPEFP